MTMIESLIAGVVQGVTEFLPVSSSGHLVLVHSFFGAGECRVFFDICLHVATLGAVVFYFRKDILALFSEPGAKGFKLILVGIIPAIIAGVLFRGHLTGLFGDPLVVGYMLIITGGVVLLGHLAMTRSTSPGKEPDLIRALLIGIAQIFALIPGISRSGTTISAGLCTGVSGKESFKFSFLMSIPLVAGAMGYEAFFGGFESLSRSDIPVYLAGMAAAFFFGLLGLRLLSWIIRTARLWVFSVYCFIMGSTALVLFLH